MKTYLAVTGALFGLLAIAHIWRIVAEWPAVIRDGGAQIEAAIGLIAAGLCLWALRLFRGRTVRQS